MIWTVLSVCVLNPRSHLISSARWRRTLTFWFSLTVTLCAQINKGDQSVTSQYHNKTILVHCILLFWSLHLTRRGWNAVYASSCYYLTWNYHDQINRNSKQSKIMVFANRINVGRTNHHLAHCALQLIIRLINKHNDTWCNEIWKREGTWYICYLHMF